MEILKQNLSIFFYLGRIGSMYMLNRVWVFCWRFLQHLLLKWSLWGEWSGRFYKRKTDNIIFERLIPSNEGISSAELDQNVLCKLITLLPPPPPKKNKQTNKQTKKDFSFQKWHNRMCHCLAFRRFVRFSWNIILTVPRSFVFKLNSSASILWCFWFFQRPKMWRSS